MDDDNYKSIDALVSNIGQRPYTFNESSGFDASGDFAFFNSELNGQLLQKLEIDSRYLIEEFGAEEITSDSILLYLALQKIIELDLFEHEGANHFMEIINEIVSNIEEGFAIFKNITCYDEADICTIKFQPGKATYFVENNPFYD